mgnify:CR=1 FL=1
MTLQDVLQQELASSVDSLSDYSPYRVGDDLSAEFKAHQFQPGETGNPGGVRKRPKSLQEIAGGLSEHRLERMVDAVARKAEAGDLRAFAELRDTRDGKPATRIIVTQSDAESPLVSALQRIASRIAQAEGVTIEGEARVLQPGADSSGVSEAR